MPNAHCPNCGATLALDARVCPQCGAEFGPGAAWQPTRKPTQPWRMPTRPAWHWWLLLGMVLGAALRFGGSDWASTLWLSVSLLCVGLPLALGALAVVAAGRPLSAAQASALVVVPTSAVMLGVLMCLPEAGFFVFGLPLYLLVAGVGALCMAWLLGGLRKSSQADE